MGQLRLRRSASHHLGEGQHGPHSCLRLRQHRTACGGYRSSREGQPVHLRRHQQPCRHRHRRPRHHLLAQYLRRERPCNGTRSHRGPEVRLRIHADWDRAGHLRDGDRARRGGPPRRVRQPGVRHQGHPSARNRLRPHPHLRPRCGEQSDHRGHRPVRPAYRPAVRRERAHHCHDRARRHAQSPHIRRNGLRRALRSSDKSDRRAGERHHADIRRKRQPGHDHRPGRPHHLLRLPDRRPDREGRGRRRRGHRVRVP